jgi:diguanylate cyclase (GGDEF)-like protein
VSIASVIDTGDAYFGPVSFDETLREPLSTMAVPLYNRRSGTVDSVIVATLRFKQIWDLLAQVTQPGDGEVYVVSAAGLVVAHGNPAVVLSGTDFELPTADGRAVGLSGKAAVIATLPLRVGEQDLTVVAEQPMSTAHRVADRAVEVVVGVTLLGIAVAITLVVLAVRLIVRPIEGLAVSADTIADGDLSHRADVSSPGEIGHLARSFNTMTTRLGQEIHSLEDRVRQRTAELEDAAAVQEELIKQLEHQATNDFLTGLPNRYSLENRLEIELARSRRLGTSVALLLLDLDDFKGVNDTFGHEIGDQLLVAVGGRLKESLRGVDAVCRLGGDEFAIIQPDVADQDQAASFAERLLAATAESFELESQEIFTGVSIGVSISDGGTRSVSEFMRQADLALYRAKDDGRNTYRFFADAMDADIRRRVRLSQDLRGAVERDELYLEYQPQVGLDDRRIVGVEALVRWRHPKFGVVGPTEVVPIAEAAGLIEEVGEWVLRNACTQARRWRDGDMPVLPVAVNVSALQVRDAGFADTVAHILTESGLEPRHLARRLRSGLRLARLCPVVPVEQDQDRPVLRPGHDDQHQERRHRRCRHRPGGTARSQGCRRGCRTRRSAGAPGRRGMRRRPGLLLQSTDPRRRDRSAGDDRHRPHSRRTSDGGKHKPRSACIQHRRLFRAALVLRSIDEMTQSVSTRTTSSQAH